jgi:murein DD-endopeptidase MepM/ murein hydrolase activator NlpD
MKPTTKIRWVFLILFVFPILACNLPVGPGTRPPRRPAGGFPAAQATQNAQLFPLPSPTPPAPGEPPAEPGVSPLLPGDAQPFGDLPYTYFAQPGDTLTAVAARFQVAPEVIRSTGPIVPEGLLRPGQALILPDPFPPSAYPNALLPDSEVVYGPSAADFDVAGYVVSAGGYLSTYQETVDNETLSGAQIIQKVATETSTNPRLLLAVLEYGSGWVLGQPRNAQPQYPIGFFVGTHQGLSKELSLTVRYLSQGYYGWRDGSFTELEFINGQKVRVSPQLNAGSVAVQHLFTKLHDRPAWEQALYGSRNGIVQTYTSMFGDPWERAARAGPLFPDGVQLPQLTLPFAPGEAWSLTGGAHIAWGVGSPRGAIDLAPVTGEKPCVVSRAWALAAAPGMVVRSEHSGLALDLDGDGREQTGLVLFYYHMAREERTRVGTVLPQDGRIGHPSCEGTRATGTHLHLTRKFNGEWLPLDGMLPFVMSGWTAHAGPRAYEGTLTRGDQVVTAYPDGERGALIIREP